MEEVKTNDQIYKVKTSIFEGPFDVLLTLIEKKKLFINEISLAEVAKDYIAYVGTMPKIDFDNTTSFLSIATTLILIKSKSLLPTIELSEEENEDVKNLEHRLMLYRIIQEVGSEVKEKYGKNIIFFPIKEREFPPVFSPDAVITKDSMLSSILDVIAVLPVVEEKKTEVEIKKVMSLEEMINSMTSRIEKAISMSFKEFSLSHQGVHNEKEKKIHVVVSFLAMLELIREGILDALQNNEFEEITITKQEKSIPENILV